MASTLEKWALGMFWSPDTALSIPLQENFRREVGNIPYPARARIGFLWTTCSPVVVPRADLEPCRRFACKPAPAGIALGVHV